MSSTLWVSENVTWMPRSAVFEYVLTAAAAHLDPGERSLLEAIHRIAEGVSWMDLRAVPASSMRAMHLALRTALEAEVDETSAPFVSYGGRDNVVGCLSLVSALVIHDGRVRTNESAAPVVVTLPGRAPATIPAWAAHLLVEHLHAFLRPAHPEWAARARIRAGLPPEAQAAVDTGIDWIRRSYPPDAVHEVRAAEFTAELAAALDAVDAGRRAVAAG